MSNIQFTCKDCAHYQVCTIIEMSASETDDYLTECGCEDFCNKNAFLPKADFIAYGEKGNRGIACTSCNGFINVKAFDYLQSTVKYCPFCGAKLREEIETTAKNIKTCEGCKWLKTFNRPAKYTGKCCTVEFKGKPANYRCTVSEKRNLTACNEYEKRDDV